MKRGLRTVLAFLGGALVGYAASIAAYVAYTEIADFHDREGAAAMGVAFFFGPVVALACGIAAAVWAARRRR